MDEIAVDTSAILAILLGEPEEEPFRLLLARTRALVGAPTVVKARLVLEGRLSAGAEPALRGFLARRPVSIVPFDAAMWEAANLAFTRYGKGRGHPAQLNFGDCLSYAVAKVQAVPLLFKGRDFAHTDLVPAHGRAP